MCEADFVLALTVLAPRSVPGDSVTNETVKHPVCVHEPWSITRVQGRRHIG